MSALDPNQEDYIEAVTTDAWELEQRVTAGHVTNPEEFLDDLFHARHGLLAVRTMAALPPPVRAPRRYPFSAARPGLVGTRPHVRPRPQRRGRRTRVSARERVEAYQTTLVIKAALVVQTQNENPGPDRASYAQNEQIKKISAWAAIFFAPTLIATVYGMNFDHMPELHWLFGYPLRLRPHGSSSSAALYVVFKRRGWL